MVVYLHIIYKKSKRGNMAFSFAKVATQIKVILKKVSGQTKTAGSRPRPIVNFYFFTKSLLALMISSRVTVPVDVAFTAFSASAVKSA